MSSVDLAIVGAGPAGLAAGIHAAREGASHAVFESGEPGGLLRAASLVENMPGYPTALDGETLAGQIVTQSRNLGVAIQRKQVLNLQRGAAEFLLHTSDEVVTAGAVILATGTRPTLPHVSGAAWAWANGLLHADMRTMPPSLEGAMVLVCGGGDAAFDASISAVRRGARAGIFVRGESVRAREGLVRKARGLGVGLHFGHTLAALATSGGGLRAGFVRAGAEPLEVPGDFLLLCCGRSPESTLWHSVTGGDEPEPHRLDPGIPGLFLAGDLIHGRCRFASVALGEGTQAAWLAVEYLRGRDNGSNSNT